MVATYNFGSVYVCVCVCVCVCVWGGGPNNVYLFNYLLTYFIEGRMDLPRETIGPKGSNCFSSGGRTSISKETYSHW